MTHRHPRWLLAAVLAVPALSAIAGPATAKPAPPASAASTPACAPATAGQARCLAMYRSTPGGTRQRSAAGATSAGYGPADLRSAYQLPSSGGTGTIAVVDAFGYPTAEADLATYRSQYGLPACTVASGCLAVVNQRGATSPLPDTDGGWGLESALDLDMASASCPGCALLLVQADDPSFANLGAAVDTAVGLGASVVSNSYGTAESGLTEGYTGHYDHPGVPVLVSSGDTGFGPASFPASLSTVIAVGGTALSKASTPRGWSETAWATTGRGDGAGSGCSAWTDKPSWQHDPNCAMRTVADVSADADPATGVAVYDNTPSPAGTGWAVVGGTSAASPFVAGVIALAGHPSTVTAAKLYGEPDAFFDAAGGSTGYCGGDYLCTGLPGYDAPTGLGSPNGISPFE